MNRTLEYIICCVLAAWMAACSNDSPLSGSAAADQAEYLGISINTPVPQPESRDGSDGNHELVDGLANEYAIDHGYLLLFEGSSAESAVFCGAFRLQSPVANGNNNPQVSQIYKLDVTLDHFARAAGQHYYGLIIVNSQGLTAERFALTYDNDGISTTIVANDGFTYANFKALKLPMRRIGAGTEVVQANNYLVDNAYYAMMTNAMLFNVTDAAAAAAVEGDSPKGQELIDVTEAISPTPIVDDASRVNFYVERVAAKVQVVLSDSPAFAASGTSANIKVSSGGSLKNVYYRIVDWCLANVSPHTYIMRQWTYSWPKLKSQKAGIAYRMISPTGIAGLADGNYKYRCYFGKSEWYGTDEWSGSRPFYAMPWTQVGAAYASYCHENTMAVEHMMVKNATHAVVRVQFCSDGSDWGADLYMDPADKSKLYTVTATGYKTLSQGYAYYILPISHFGDVFTPWRNGESSYVLPFVEGADAATNIGYSYPLVNRDENYLGRWGVVRNNWYVITLTGIKGVGSPVNPLVDPSVITADSTPLDYYDTQIRATLSVRAWIIRDQTQTLE